MDDPGTGNIVFDLIFLLVLIFINAYLAMAETAITLLNDSKVEKMADGGSKKAKKVLQITKKPSAFLSVIQICITFICVLLAITAAHSFAPILSNAFLNIMPNISIDFINALSIFIISLIVSYISLVFSEFVPRKIAMQKPEKIAFATVSPLLFLIKITKPVAKMYSLTTNLIIRIFGFDPNVNEDSVTEEEIRMLYRLDMDATAERLLSAGISLVVVTRGAKGSILYGRDYKIELDAGDAKPIDTTAAGDCFFGSLIASLMAQEKPMSLARESVERAALMARAAAEISITRPGGMQSMPYLREIE